MMPDPQTQEFLTRRTLETAQDALLEKIIQEIPALGAQARIIAQALRENVQWERRKRRLDSPKGTIWLYASKQKQNKSQPDFIGKGKVAGLSYKAAAWVNDQNAWRIGLTQEQHHG